MVSKKIVYSNHLDYHGLHCTADVSELLLQGQCSSVHSWSTTICHGQSLPPSRFHWAMSSNRYSKSNVRDLSVQSSAAYSFVKLFMNCMIRDMERSSYPGRAFCCDAVHSFETLVRLIPD